MDDKFAIGTLTTSMEACVVSTAVPTPAVKPGDHNERPVNLFDEYLEDYRADSFSNDSREPAYFATIHEDPESNAVANGKFRVAFTAGHLAVILEEMRFELAPSDEATFIAHARFVMMVLHTIPDYRVLDEDTEDGVVEGNSVDSTVSDASKSTSPQTTKSTDMDIHCPEQGPIKSFKYRRIFKSALSPLDLLKGGTKCHICFEDFGDGPEPEFPLKLDCGHEFGAKCVRELLRRSGLDCVCPLCRKPLDASAFQNPYQLMHAIEIAGMYKISWARFNRACAKEKKLRPELNKAYKSIQKKYRMDDSSRWWITNHRQAFWDFLCAELQEKVVEILGLRRMQYTYNSQD